MKEVSIKDLSRLAATYIGDTLADVCQPEDSPFPGIEERMRALAPGLLRDIIMRIPEGELTDGIYFNGLATIDVEGTVTLVLPDDFLRLVSVKMSDWRREVRQLTTPGDEAYARQRSRFAGVRGTPERPVAVAGYTDSGSRCLKMYSSGANASPEYLIYIGEPKVSGADTIMIPAGLMHELLKEFAAFWLNGLTGLPS